MNKELIMYSRSYGCPFVTTARSVLLRFNVPYHEIHIDKDTKARDAVIAWTGFQSVPTLVVANQGETTPYTQWEPLPAGTSPRGIDRGPMITEANAAELEVWLRKNGFIRD